ncbi:hypothetical protein HMPREF9005_1180 [Actinomyces sp. oral taxon 178 str. F0338]|nr:hypothetical protein HMPREF9005_1180 [Actinomyces sp. oral taxon 178 str. F0338]
MSWPRQGGRRAGSSPRVRGKRLRRHHRGRRWRLIPARAGKTTVVVGFISCSQAHPRACGENKLMQHPFVSLQGSSPRVRGKLRVPCLFEFLLRLIPARAGKTKQSKPHYVGAWAHPRACGENHVVVRAQARPLWLIPARAGKTGALATAHR